MNIIKLLQIGGFPFETNTLDFMQKAYSLFNSLGYLAGSNVIISGCEVVGATTKDGVIFYNGELLTFKGSVNQSSVVIKETITTALFKDGTTKDVYTERYATFGTGTTQIPWSSFTRIENLVSLANKITTNTNSIDSLESSVNESLVDLKIIIETNKTDINKVVTNNKTELTEDINKVKESIPEPASNAETIRGVDSKKYVTPEGLASVLPIVPILLSGKVSSTGSRLGYFNKTFTSLKVSTGLYRITHSLGHTNYGVSGAGIGGAGNIKLSIKSLTNNYCEIGLSDDISLNNASFVFQIFKTSN